jgi:holo-[acyl-carrier protein] synthase
VTAAPRVGVDVVDLGSFRARLARRPSLLERVFTSGERRDCLDRSDPVPGLAARFAAKEAAMKALGCGLGAVGLRELEVRRSASGEPVLELSGRAARRAAELALEHLAVSMSHDRTTAVAVVLAC